MHRFFVSPSSLQGDRFSSEESDLCHQIWKVLKLRKGEHVMLLDNTEHEYLMELTDINKSRGAGRILEKIFKPDISNSSTVHLFVPPLKNPARFEWMVEKCTEIGVASFTPLLTERTEVKELRKMDRLLRIIKEAAELSGRTRLPMIHEPVEFSVIASAEKQPHEVNLIATLTLLSDPSAPPTPITQLSFGRNDKKNYNLLFGPVGDFTKAEVDLALQHGYHAVSLGRQILRTETAAIVASSFFLPA